MSIIDPDISIKELVSKFPVLTDHLILKYEFHCVGCFASAFETLREGAAVHGITGPYFEELLADLNSLITAAPEDATAA